MKFPYSTKYRHIKNHYSWPTWFFFFFAFWYFFIPLERLDNAEYLLTHTIIETQGLSGSRAYLRQEWWHCTGPAFLWQNFGQKYFWHPDYSKFHVRGFKWTNYQFNFVLFYSYRIINAICIVWIFTCHKIAGPVEPFLS